MHKRRGPIDLSHVDAPRVTDQHPIQKVSLVEDAATPPFKKKRHSLPWKTWVQWTRVHILTLCTTASDIVMNIWQKMRKVCGSFRMPKLISLSMGEYLERTKILQERVFALGVLSVVIIVFVFQSGIKTYVLAQDVRRYVDTSSQTLDTVIVPSIVNGEYLKAQVYMQNIVQAMRDMESMLPPMSAPLFRDQSVLQSVKSLIEATKNMTSASDALLVVYGNITQLLTDIVRLSPEEYKARYVSLAEYLHYQWQLIVETVIPAIRTTDAVLTSLPKDLFPERWKEGVERSHAMIDQLLAISASIDEMMPAVMTLLGEREPKTYVVLLQNSMEMRATGGFIGSILLIKVNDGWIDKMEWRDVYDFDGQIYESILPPKGIDQVSEQFRLRDANYWPDFPTSARQVAWFLDKQKGPGVDGVIAINDVVVRDLLSIVGSVPMEDGYLMSSENFIPFLSYMVESKAAGDAPKDILFTFAESFLKEVTASIINRPEIAQTLIAHISQKNIVGFSFDEDVETLFHDMGMSGEIFHYDVPEKNHIQDYAMLVHTSVGGNKSDYFMKEQVEHTSNLVDPKRVENTLLLQRHHTISEESRRVLLGFLEELGELNETLRNILVDGENKHYLRWYLPIESTDIRLEGADHEQIQIDIYEDLGKKVVGFMSVVPSGESREYRLHYSLSTEREGNEPLTYNLVYEKEPGGKNIPLRKAMDVNSGTVIAEYTNKKVTNLLQPLVLDNEPTNTIVTNRSVLSYLLYTE